jgi:DUF1365 family protein
MSELGSPLESAIYKGFVRHRRLTPVSHQFDNKLFMLLLKVDEIPRVLKSFWQLGSGRLSWGRLHRTDYIGPTDQPIEDAVKAKIAEKLGAKAAPPDGDVYMLVHLRYFGFYFSPLNLYYLKCNGQFKYMLAEVSNTPWLEKHYYLVDLENIEPHSKEFHVSPFNPMAQNYHWRIIPPTSEQEKCLVQIQAHDQKSSIRVFDATLSLDRVPLNQTQLTRVLLSTPMQTLSVAWGIYWQALKLFFKRAPFYSHPNKNKTNAKEGTL